VDSNEVNIIMIIIYSTFKVKKCGFISLLLLPCIKPTSQINPHFVFVHANSGLTLHERRPPFTHARTGTHSHLVWIE
jgi:hypothetical protein